MCKHQNGNRFVFRINNGFVVIVIIGIIQDLSISNEWVLNKYDSKLIGNNVQWRMKHILRSRCCYYSFNCIIKPLQFKWVRSNCIK